MQEKKEFTINRIPHAYFSNLSTSQLFLAKSYETFPDTPYQLGFFINDELTVNFAWSHVQEFYAFPLRKKSVRYFFSTTIHYPVIVAENIAFYHARAQIFN